MSMATDNDSFSTREKKNKNEVDIPQKNQQEEAYTTKHKRRGAIPSSASAHDLRSLEMEKEAQDGSSPRGVLEAYFKGLESETSSPQTGNEKSEVDSSNSRAISNWSRFFKVWKKKSIKNLASFPPTAVPKLSKRKSRSTKENPMMRDIYNFKSTSHHFSFSELQHATNNFCDENIIGKGGYAKVYKGCLRDGKFVAIKRLTVGTPDERTAGFLSELGIIAHIDHPNTAKLIGVGIEGGMHLVFELSALGSLGSLLHCSDVKLEWSRRYKIALGIADGVLYLHETCQKRIIHRDIKADNILLTDDFEAQICDFGLAKWLPKDCTHHTVSKFEGTFGYFAPEYFMHGIVDEKTDIYAFGVLLLELITGRRALDNSQQSLVIWAKPLLDSNDIKELIDPAISEEYDKEEMDNVILTASLCIEQSPILRPRMSQVVILLRGDGYAADCGKGSHRRTLQRTYSEELLDAQEYNSTRYLNDICRHMEIALGS